MKVFCSQWTPAKADSIELYCYLDRLLIKSLYTVTIAGTEQPEDL